MKTEKTILAASVVALGLLSYPALSQAFDGGGYQRAGHHCMRSGGDMQKFGWERMADRLHLTKEQREAMKTIAEKYRPGQSELRQLLKDNRAALQKMTSTDAKLTELAEAQGKTMADMIVLRKKMRDEMSAVLTDDQRQALSKMLERRDHHHHRHGEMGHG
jgi:Spy/CpxP family protein refolding chaperone